MEFIHVPVMAREAIDALCIRRDGVYVDCTLGGAGHTRLILAALGENGRVIGIDRDGDAVANARETINDSRFVAVRDNYENIETVLHDAGYEQADGILMDLGVSSHQLDTPERGFSYMKDAALDMRMDTSAPLTAYDVVNGYSEQRLTRLLYDYGEERSAPRIASAIIKARSEQAITGTLMLSEIITSAIPAKLRHEGHPAKKSFQAIRIEVNGELTGLADTIESGANLLSVGGRMAIISFHSLEDRIVKNSFQRLERPCTCPSDFPICVCGKKQVVRIITKKPLLPDETELNDNKRSHSAKLRVCEKV